MAIKVIIPTSFRECTQGRAAVEVDAKTVADAFAQVGAQYPAFTNRVLDNGALRRFVNVYVNDNDIRSLDNLSTETRDGDEILLVPAIAGGAR